jgi:hypothetical protein
MSTSEPDFEQLLRKAIQKAKESAPRAVADLQSISSRAAEAVDRVTAGTAALDLVPIKQEEDGSPLAFQLQLRKVNSDAPATDLGVYQVSAATGYPVQRWYSRKGWASGNKPDQEYMGSTPLASNFEWIVSNPESRLVVLVTYFQEQIRAAAGTTSSGS